MGSLSIDTASSLAWKEICKLVDRPNDVLAAEWGVSDSSLVESPGTPDERFLFANGGRKLVVARVTNGNEVTAHVKEFARVRRFEIEVDEHGQPVLTERGKPRMTVREFLERMVGWLKTGRAAA